ncbi:MAG TPA: DUF6291 domain-containing protein, partial [Oscillospiraceae bacterium]|nr:DUF6291 domain-containing protein [Oscillospiraceae bacterium]
MPNVTFYPSYIKAMKTLQPNEQLQLFWAITNRTLGEADFPMDEKISGMFALIEPIIESNRKRFENGKKGGEFGKLGGRPKKQTAQRKNTEKSASPEEFGGSCCRNP